MKQGTFPSTSEIRKYCFRSMSVSCRLRKYLDFGPSQIRSMPIPSGEEVLGCLRDRCEFTNGRELNRFLDGTAPVTFLLLAKK